MSSSIARLAIRRGSDFTFAKTARTAPAAASIVDTQRRGRESSLPSVRVSLRLERRSDEIDSVLAGGGRERLGLLGCGRALRRRQFATFGRPAERAHEALEVSARSDV